MKNEEKLNTIDTVVSIVEGLIVIATTLGGILVSIKGKSFYYFIVGLAIAEAIGIVFLIRFVIRLKKENILYTLKIMRVVHKKFLHKIRDHVHILNEKKNSIKKLNLNNENDKKTYDSSFENEFSNLKSNLIPAINCLSDIISDYVKQDVSACVKIFTLEELPGHPMDRNVTTFVRSENTDPERVAEEADSIPVKDNTDFKKLCRGGAFFGCGNLERLQSGGNYENDSDNWKLKYNSALVVPIRYKPESLNPRNPKREMNILGFLCIDSLKENPQWEKKDSLELQILGMFADAMYIYLSAFVECFEREA